MNPRTPKAIRVPTSRLPSDRVRSSWHSRTARRTLGLATAVFVLGAGVVPAEAATTDGGVAWTVQTADNDNGTGRGNFTYDVTPGAVITDAMVVVNTGTVPLPLSVYAADAFTTPSGEIDVLIDGSPSVDAGTWVAVDPATLELAPGQRTEVSFSISVPADARPGDHAAGIVTALSSQDASQSLSIDRRLGTRINLRVAGDLLPGADVSGVTARYTPSWNPFAPGVLTVAYALANSGNTRLTGTETVSAGGPLGVFGASSPPAQLPEVIPGSVIEVTRDIPVLSIGWLSGEITVEPQGVGLGAGIVAPLTVGYSALALPWSLFVLLLLVAGAVVAATLLVRRRRLRSLAGAARAPDAA